MRCAFEIQLSSFPSSPMSISSRQRPPLQLYKHFQLVSQTLQTRFSGCHRFSFSPFLSRCSSHSAWSHETGLLGKLGHGLAQRDRKAQNTVQISSCYTLTRGPANNEQTHLESPSHRDCVLTSLWKQWRCINSP